MTDIVQRLRDTIVNETARYPEVIEAAISAIEFLRHQVETVGNERSYAEAFYRDALEREGRLRSALKEISDYGYDVENDDAFPLKQIARRALEQEVWNLK